MSSLIPADFWDYVTLEEATKIHDGMRLYYLRKAVNERVINNTDPVEELIYREVNNQYENLKVFDIIAEKFNITIPKERGKTSNFINNNLPILSVASKYSLNVKKNKCPCPFHADKDPSLVFYPNTNSFYCFGCKVGGDVITFIQKMEGVKHG